MERVPDVLPPTKSEVLGGNPYDFSPADLQLRKVNVKCVFPNHMFALTVAHDDEAANRLAPTTQQGLLTAEELTQFFAWSARFRSLGCQYTMDDLIRWGMVRPRAAPELDLVLDDIALDTPPPKAKEFMAWTPTKDPPAGWVQGIVDACVRCGRGTIWRDPAGKSRHPSCGDL